MKSSFFLTVLFLLAVTGAFCQSVPWERINPNPIESSLKEIVHVPGTNRLVAIGTGATLLYTENMGASWNINYYPSGISRMVNLNAIQFVDSNLGFAAGDNSTLIKTVNGGQSWTTVVDSGDVNFIDVFFIDEQTGFVTKKNSVMKTTDGGTTWVSTYLSPASPYFSPKYLHFINDSTGFIGNTGGLYYFKTTNAGDSWDSVSITTAIEGFSLQAIQFLDENTGFVSGYVYNSSSSAQYILRTSDGGATWQEVYTDPFNNVQDFYFFDAQTGFATSHRVMYDNMILRTVDGGLTWQEANMPYSFLFLTAPSFLENGYGLCVGDYGQILKSIDWGQNWFTRYQWTFQTADINDAQVVDQTTVFIGTTTIGGGGIASGCIYKSTDGGYSWDKMFEANPIYVLQFLNPSFGVTISDYLGVLYKTTDGGATWKTVEINYYDFDAESLWFINEQTGFVGGHESNAVIYKTSDSCKTWVKSDVWFHRFNEINNIAFADDSNGFAVSRYLQDYFLRTYNQGDTWVVDSFDVSASVRKIYFINSDTGFAIGNKILKTTDGGDTWAAVQHDLEGQYEFTDIDFPTEDVGYITVSDNAKTLLRTDDGGDSWYSLDYEFYTTSAPEALAFFSKDEGLVMGENSIIFKTYTGGFVGIDENKSNATGDTGLICYPNPATSSLTIVFPDKNAAWQIVSFYTIAGRLVKKVIFSGHNKNATIDLTGLNEGVYLVVAESPDGNKSSAKIVKF